MAEWFVDHYTHDGTLIATVHPESLHFTLNKKPPHTIEYEVSHSAKTDAGVAIVNHDFVGPYRTDFKLRRGTLVIMEGMHTSFNVSGEAEFTAIAGKDWSHYLELRHFPFDPTNPNAYIISNNNVPGNAYTAYGVDVATIIKNILDKVLARPNSLAITYPTLSATLGIVTNYQLSLVDTSSILQIIDSLSDIYPGFDYEVLPTKELRVYSPHKYDIGVATDQTLANFSFVNEDNLISVDFTNTGPGGTHILATGAGLGQYTLAAAYSSPANEAVYRRMDVTESYDDVPNKTQIENRAKVGLGYQVQPRHEIEITVVPDGITDFWLLAQPGYAIWLDQELTSHRIQSGQEIVSMECTVNDEGDETVVMGLNQIYAPTTIGVEG